ncbi:MAG: UPF0182 family protein [Micrococcaceae bacterium]|nr:UPF0182 family protein [Micrococcaceae bacterium]
MSFGQGFGGVFGRPDDSSGGSDDSGGSSRGFGFSSGSGGSGDDDRGNTGGTGMRRPGALLLTLIILGVLVALFVLFAMVYTEVLWFNQLGYEQVFWTEHITRAILFVVAGVVMAAITWLALHLAYKYRPKNLAGQLRRNVEQYQKQLEPIRRLVFIGAPILIGFFAGTAAMNGWEQVLLFFNQVPYGQQDPEFGLDLTFYMATLPFLNTIASFLVSVVLVAGIAGLVVHYLYGGIRIEEGSGITVERAARFHILVFAGVYMLLQAGRYWLNRYETLQDQSGNWAGAMYTDVNAVIPTSTILAIAAIIVIGLFIATMVTGRWRLSIIGVAGFLVAALIAGAIYPFLIQEYRVSPSEETMEAPYIERNIAYTRDGYDIADVDYTDYAGETEAQEGALAGDAETTANVRLMDPNLLSETFGQLQQFRPYYSFPDILHIDRYNIDGEVHDTVLAAREVSPPGDDSWVNQHTIYTHGYGVVAADAAEVGAGGRPSFLLSGIPTSGELATEEEYEPRIYFGLNSPEYSIVGKEEGQPDRERDRPAEQGSEEEDTAYTFTGDGGPSIGNFFNQLAYAIKFGSTEILLSQNVDSNSQIMFDRTPVERVQKVAPYLEVDPNTYPAIVDGRVEWIVEGYTTSDAFPYSDQSQLESATAGTTDVDQSLTLTGQINYIRNSVKATVDAYDGSVNLYAWDPEDPLLQAWSGVYGDTIQPYSEMSAELMEHVRYPEDMFNVQREKLTRYHVSDPGDFYQANDEWSVPDDPTAAAESNTPIPPFYMTMQMPGQDPAFQLTTPFIPQTREGETTRNVLYGFLGANGNAGTGEDGVKADTYGHLQMLELPRQTTTPGPGQAQNNFNSDDTVSQELNLLRQGASDVINGNMITLPVAEGVMYVQPVYVRSTGETSYPVLQKVLVAFGNEVGFADTFAEALDQVFEGDAGAETPVEMQDEGEAPTESDDPQTEDPAEGDEQQAEPPMADAPSDQLDQALQDARDAMSRSEEAMADGDWAAYGEAQADLQAALEEAIELDDGEAPASDNGDTDNTDAENGSD